MSTAFKSCKTQDARRTNSLSPYLDCTALTRKRNTRFARRASCVHTADCESTNSNGNSLLLGAALFHENDGFCEENMTIKTHPRKIYAAMKCECVEISEFLQVMFKL